jgi:non-ribosomal peptide synthetase component E (peptide arylation enzyme)
MRLDAGGQLTLPMLQSHLEASGLGRQKWPEELRIIDDLPRTPSGKVRKADLRSQLRQEAGAS